MAAPLLVLARVMWPAAELLKVASPVMFSALPVVWLMWPTLLRAKSPATVKAPSCRLLASRSVTSRPESTVTAPTKSLAVLFSDRALLAPTARLVLPCTVMAPDCVSAPSACSVRLPPMAEVPRSKVEALRNCTWPLAPPVVLSATVPLRLLPALPKAMLAPLRLLLPPTRKRVPASWVRAPLALMSRWRPSAVWPT